MTSRNGRRSAAAVAAAALLAGGFTSTAAGQPSVPHEPERDSTLRAASAAPADARPSTITLISGHRLSVRGDDTVRVINDGDGDLGPLMTRRTPSGTTVIPAELRHLVPDRLDPRLFDVDLLGTLAERGEEIPLIVELAPQGETLDGAASTAADSDVLAATGLSVDLELESIGAFSTSVSAADVNDAEAIDALLATLGEEPLSSGVQKVWLSAPVTTADEDSNPQIGAPEAWERGLTGEGVRVAVLDTGIDTSHPDLDANVVAEEDFSGSPDPGDRIGHGTHVAGIVAGSGDGAPQRPGIAYGAELLNGKVFDDDGYGDEATIIAGMEWAVEQDADVVNMSLGGAPSDGTDPLSEALNALTEESGALFVVSAGNDGAFGDYSVTSPSVADHALAVASVDKDDVLAWDSSVGPRYGDDALKPDLAAPGVDIIAALADGAFIGEPVDDLYTSVSGTSMAAPHVAGAAAILLQEDSDLDAGELKARLMGSSVGVGHTVWQEGAGRLDIPAALDATVHAETPSLSFGAVPAPWDEQAPITLPLTFHNTGDADIELTLDTVVTGPDGEPAPAGLVTLDSATLTVPAGEVAGVEATLDGAAATDHGLIGGVVTATGEDGGSVRVPLGLHLEQPTDLLTIEGIDLDGAPVEWAPFDLVDLQTGEFVGLFEEIVDGVATLEVPSGDYLLIVGFFGDDGEWALPIDPALVVDGDTTVTVDAREAEPFVVDTHRPSEALDKTLGLTLESADDQMLMVFEWVAFGEETLLTSASGSEAAAGRIAVDYYETRTGPAEAPSSLLPRLPYGYAVHQSTPSMPQSTTIVADETTTATVRTGQYDPGYLGDALPVAAWTADPPTIGSAMPALSPVESPGQRLEYLSGGMDWLRESELLLDDEEDPFGGDLTSPWLTLEAGDRVDLPWGPQVLRPGLAQETPPWTSVHQDAEGLFVALPMLVDGARNASFWSTESTARLRLWGDGELVSDESFPFAWIEEPGEGVEYRMLAEVTRDDAAWAASTASSTEWTFTSEAVGEESVPLPLLEAHVQPRRLDVTNAVTRTVDLHVVVEHQIGADTDAEITDATLEWSAGGAWQAADLVTVEPGAYTTRLDLPAGTEAVDLRVSAEDSDGATVTSEIERALLVEASVARSAGTDRYGTAAAIARLHGFSDVAYLASGEQFPDALSVGGVAGALEAPVLLTQPGHLPAVTETALLETGAREVRILGGADAVGGVVADELADLGYDVTRVEGDDRYDTAARLAEGAPTGGTVIVASGEVYADALAGGPLAAQDGRPVLLVRGNHLPSATADALVDLAPEEIVLLGGRERVDADVETALAAIAPTTRLAGDTRYDTAGLAAALLGGVAPEGTGSAYVASGLDWPDALTLGARSGAESDPVLLVKDAAVPSATAAALVELDTRRVIAAGGDTAIGDTVLEALAVLLDD